MAAVVSLAFAAYLLPGLWGAPLRSVSAFTPPLSTQDFNLYEAGKFVKYDDFDEGMEAAKKMEKPVFLDFPDTDVSIAGRWKPLYLRMLR